MHDFTYFRQPNFTKFEQNTSIGVAVFPFLPLESIQSHSPGLYTPYKKPVPNFL